jgi:hypothetical protein
VRFLGDEAFADCCLDELVLGTSVGIFEGRLFGRLQYHSPRLLVCPTVDASPGARALVRALEASTILEDDQYFCGNGDESAIDLPAASRVELVSAPDEVVAALGGRLAEFTSMAKVPVRNRVSPLFVLHWTHQCHKLCTWRQRCAVWAVLLSAQRVRMRVGCVRIVLPLELWDVSITFLRRCDLGVAQ